MCDKTRDLFAKHGLRRTKQRVDVYNALRDCKAHPTAEELQRLVCDASDCDSISLATVYNTLEALHDAGLCRKIPTSSGSRYDADMECHLHVCMDDGRLVDVPNDLSQRILDSIPQDCLEELSDQMGLTISHLGVQVFADPDKPRLPSSPAC